MTKKAQRMGMMRSAKMVSLQSQNIIFTHVPPFWDDIQNHDPAERFHVGVVGRIVSRH